MDGTNFVDVISIILIFWWVGFMWRNCGGYESTVAEAFTESDKDVARNGMALTAAMFWLNLLLYLRTVSVDFAVFVGGVFFVLKRLATFLVSLLIVLLAFVSFF